MFITFEGIDGSGKSTLIQRVGKALKAIYGDDRVVVLREPASDTQTQRNIRNAIMTKGNERLTEFLLFQASRSEMVAKQIRPALEDNKIVLCDRFTDSTIAYQGAGRGIDMSLIEQMNTLTTGGIKPDRTYYLDIPIDVAKTRINGGAREENNHIDAEDEAFFTIVSEQYDRLVEHNVDGRYYRLNATKSPSALAETVVGHIIEGGVPDGC